MKALRGMLAVIMLLAFAMSIFALARAGPTEKAFTHQAIVVDVPVMTEQATAESVVNYIQIESMIAGTYFTDTSGATRLSTTVAKHSRNEVSTIRTARSAPMIVMLA